MSKLDNLIKYQKERDRLNVLIDEQFKIIMSADTTMEETRGALEEHSKLINEYLEVCQNFREAI
ncbi:MAG: hypothetical protein ACRDA4_10470 [Filifactoraceae bacterium]